MSADPLTPGAAMGASGHAVPDVGAVLVGPDRYEPGAPVIEDGRIVELCRPARRFARRFAVAGLSNAHVHLDLSLCASVPRATRGFARWLSDLLAARGPFDPRAFQRGAERGAMAALAAGTVAVGDIDSSGAAACAVAASGLAGVSFREVLGRRTDEEWRGELEKWLRSFESFAPGSRLRPGLSPHAPYSTRESLYRLAGGLARASGLPRTTHIAETEEEARLLRDGGGELASLLRSGGLGLPFETPPMRSPIAWLERAGELDGMLLAHANYPEEGDLERMVRAGVGVAFCPRSHCFFGHRRHPVAEYLAHGIPVALGTDSLASNSSLSILDELAFLRAARPDLSCADLWRMATESGARLLGVGSGRLDVGASADLAIVEWRHGLPRSLEEALDAVTSGFLMVHATIVSGMVCYMRGSSLATPVPLTAVQSGLFSTVSA